VLEEHGVEVLVTGVRVPGTATSFGRNYVHVGVRTTWYSSRFIIVITAPRSPMTTGETGGRQRI
jgi:hypothetical protein